MPSNLREPQVVERDGTSQAGRALPALLPSYVAVDERTPQDHLAFARAYGGMLTYYDQDNNPAGDFGSFLGPQLQPEDVVAFLRSPEKFTAQTRPELFRPHFVLFLAFLKLHEKLGAELNTLTSRHLQFYYEKFLRMARRPSIPDRVNLVIQLAADGSEVRLAGGSLLDAGPDSLGRKRIYATDRDGSIKLSARRWGCCRAGVGMALGAFRAPAWPSGHRVRRVAWWLRLAAAALRVHHIRGALYTSALESISDDRHQRYMADPHGVTGG